MIAPPKTLAAAAVIPSNTLRTIGCMLSGVANVHDVAVFHDVILAFEAQRAFAARVRLRTRLEQLVPVDGLRPDEMFFQVGVDRAGRFHRAPSAADGPGA